MRRRNPPSEVYTAGKVFWGEQGAGVLPYCPRTGRILLGFRSGKVHGPHEWAIFGGAMEDDQTPIECAHSELVQETGYRGPIQFIEAPAYVEGIHIFYNFIGVVPAEYRPVLNWEHDAAQWCRPSRLPTPLHVGVAELIRHFVRTMR